MREIKFRAKDLIHNQWIYGGIAVDSGNNTVILPTDWSKGGCVDKETVGQFTGLHDKNGKEIYEGDILRTSISRMSIGVVEWDCDKAKFVVRMIDSTQCYPLDKRDEIIGNIHNNIELTVHRCCGTCVNFEDEDAYGNGYCNVNNKPRNCTSGACGKWEEMKEGGTE